MYGDFLQAVILLWLDYFSGHLSVPIHSSHAVLLIMKLDCLTATSDGHMLTVGLLLPPVLRCGTCVYEKVSNKRKVSSSMHMITIGFYGCFCCRGCIKVVCEH